ncbi:hypothetical protein GN956_G110 [Arapaima gigas]
MGCSSPPDEDLAMESRVPHHIPGVSSSVVVEPLLDARVPCGRLPHPLTIFPIDRMKSSHVENDYIDSPAIVQQPLANQKPTRGLHEAALGASHPSRSHRHDVTHPWITFGGRPGSVGSSSSGSASSEQRLLDHAAPAPVAEAHSGSAGPANYQPKILNYEPAEPKCQAAAKAHVLPCETCGRCRCTECTLPRTLPSCWVCNQECLCSAQSLVDAATCMCLVKGVFYHCTDEEDDEGSCADRPCSCGPPNRCARWTFMGTLSLVLPCLLCYLPATGCTKLSQRCYDGARRPGCRCKNSQASLEGKGSVLGIQAS